MPYMSLAERLKALRLNIGISQEAIGAQGFVSTHFWIKVERGLRSPSEELIMRLVSWLLKEEYFSVNTAGALLDELLVLKYLGSSSPFIQKMALNYAERITAGTPLLVAEDMGVYRTKTRKRQRPHSG